MPYCELERGFVKFERIICYKRDFCCLKYVIKDWLKLHFFFLQAIFLRAKMGKSHVNLLKQIGTKLVSKDFVKLDQLSSVVDNS